MFRTDSDTATPSGERRRLPRMQLGCPMTFSGLDGSGPFVGKALSVSGGGLLFETGAIVSTGDRLSVTVTPPLALTGPLRARLCVLRVSESDNPRMPVKVAGRFEWIAPPEPPAEP
ncbi:MAG: hypothetical protein D6729_16375 [Deltaproteobacteria bacterium]|nr:MAG: hypothetical protein D6729_16375 [Deltaproteobacteria bacterium]